MKKYLVAILLLTGCVSTPDFVDIKFYEGPELSKDQLASLAVTFHSGRDSIKIGQKSYNYSKWEVVHFDLKPGKHEVYF
ncbi:MAG: hypothetical protein ACR2QW_05335, partial [bacterium]